MISRELVLISRQKEKTQSERHFRLGLFFRGSDGNRTRDGGFADRCLTTWLHYQNIFKGFTPRIHIIGEM